MVNICKDLLLMILVFLAIYLRWGVVRIADLVKRISREPDLLEQYGRSGRRKIEERWDINQTSRRIADLIFSAKKIRVCKH